MANSIILTGAIGADHTSYLRITAPIASEYAQTHGAAFYAASEADMERFAEKRPPSWAKVNMILEFFKKYDMIMWIDADACIVNSEENIFHVLQEKRDIGLCCHSTKTWGYVPNMGVFVIRTSTYIRQLFWDMWFAGEKQANTIWWEQNRFLELINWDYKTPVSDNEKVQFLATQWNDKKDEEQHPFTAFIEHWTAGDHEWRMAGLQGSRAKYLNGV